MAFRGTKNVFVVFVEIHERHETGFRGFRGPSRLEKSPCWPGNQSGTLRRADWISKLTWLFLARKNAFVVFVEIHERHETGFRGFRGPSRLEKSPCWLGKYSEPFIDDRFDFPS